jgi:hypothetical protein
MDGRGVRACPQTDRIFNTDRRVLFLHRLAYQVQPHSPTHAYAKLLCNSDLPRFF